MGGRKGWLEAAAIILTGGTQITRIPLTNSIFPPWSNWFDYRVLMLRRRSKGFVIADTGVFPGGVLKPADADQGWFELLQSRGLHRDNIEQLALERRSPSALQREGGAGDITSKELGLRIAAIRNTFESTGLLLASKNQLDRLQAIVLDPIRADEWQKKVKKDPLEFLEFCKQLEEVPAVASLVGWSSWADQPARRLKTSYFMASLPTVPSRSGDQGDVEWATPGTILGLYQESLLWLLPSQMYELSRLLSHPRLDELSQFVRMRQLLLDTCHESHERTTWQPIREQCEDGQLLILPGDSRYPEDEEELDGLEGMLSRQYRGTTHQAAQTSSALNRIVFKESQFGKLEVRTTAANGHPPPPDYEQIKREVFGIPPPINQCSHCSDMQIRFCHQSLHDDWQHGVDAKRLKKFRNDATMSKFMSRHCTGPVALRPTFDD